MPDDKTARVRELLAQGRVWLAPMAGVTDPLFRTICIEHGCTLATTEMVSATGLAYASKATRELYEPAPAEKLVAVQLFGADPDEMARGAAEVERELGERLALIDINMGCPVPKVTKRGAGSALMRTPELAAKIIAAVDAAVSVPVTCKYRRGWNLEEADPTGFGLRLQEAGAAAVCVHGRTTGQLYRGVADWGCIADVKAALSIPVIGNGDITGADVALSRLRETGVDGLMVARGAQGNPWIFEQIATALVGGEPHVPSPVERIETLRDHARRFAAWQAEKRRAGAAAEPHISAMRKHAMWYLAGLPGARRLRGESVACTTLADFEAFCDRALGYVAEFEAAKESS